jgi:transposase
MIPSSVSAMMASSEDWTIAASCARSASARFRSVMSVAKTASPSGESYRVGRRAHSERGWDPWDHTPEHPSQWAAIRSVGEKLGIRTESLRRWVRQAERDGGKRSGLTTTEREELKRLQRENVELKRANEILRKASAFFAQAELDRRPK